MKEPNQIPNIPVSNDPLGEAVKAQVAEAKRSLERGEQLFTIESQSMAGGLGALPDGTNPEKYVYFWHRPDPNIIDSLRDGVFYTGVRVLLVLRQGDHANIPQRHFRDRPYVYDPTTQLALLYTSKEAFQKYKKQHVFDPAHRGMKTLEEQKADMERQKKTSLKDTPYGRATSEGGEAVATVGAVVGPG